MNTEYRIRTIEDFLAVPEDKLPACFADFTAWLNLARQSDAITASMTELLGGGVKFHGGAFVWVDDGISGLSAIDFITDDDERIGRLQIDPSGT